MNLLHGNIWKHKQWCRGLKKRDFQTETALMYDAVILFAEALSELDRSQDVQVNILTDGVFI